VTPTAPYKGKKGNREWTDHLNSPFRRDGKEDPSEVIREAKTCNLKISTTQIP